MPVRFAHTNLVAQDLARVVSFYVDVFGCVRGVERLYETPEQSAALERGLGVPGLRVRGALLLLPGHGDHGPALEVMQYQPSAARPAVTVVSPGFGHVAFEVDDIEAVRHRVVAAGGALVAEVVTVPYPTGGWLRWCYVRDPEGNVVELQCRSPQRGDVPVR